MERTSLTRGAKLLEASDLIERSGEAGTRKRALRITDKGLSLLREAYPLWEKAQLETEALLGDEIDETNRFLNLLRNGPLS